MTTTINRQKIVAEELIRSYVRKRIKENIDKKLIAENTDPFTTDADIRFFETEKWMAKNSS